MSGSRHGCSLDTSSAEPREGSSRRTKEQRSVLPGSVTPGAVNLDDFSLNYSCWDDGVHLQHSGCEYGDVLLGFDPTLTSTVEAASKHMTEEHE